MVSVETFHTLSVDEASVMTPHMPLSGGDSHTYPQLTLEESKRSIVEKRSNFGRLRGQR